MAWDVPDVVMVGEVIETAWGDSVRASLSALSTHAHTGAAGDGNDELIDVDKITMDDIGAPAAPGADDTILAAVSGKLTQRAGAGGTTEAFATTSHATEHEPGGADPMDVDGIAAAGFLRTLGTGALQIATGDHTHP